MINLKFWMAQCNAFISKNKVMRKKIGLEPVIKLKREGGSMIPSNKESLMM